MAVEMVYNFQFVKYINGYELEGENGKCFKDEMEKNQDKKHK